MLLREGWFGRVGRLKQVNVLIISLEFVGRCVRKIDLFSVALLFGGGCSVLRFGLDGCEWSEAKSFFWDHAYRSPQ